VILGFDTATPSTAAAVLLDDGTVVERRDDPAPGERPRHASRLLELIEEALAGAQADWEAVTRLAVGVGPGGFTGLRIGIATARALAQARLLEVTAVSSLMALAAGASHDGPVAAVIDARRGEAYFAAYDSGRPVAEPAALSPERLAAAVAELRATPLAVGDGALRFRVELERAGAAVPADDDPVHRVSAVAICRLGETAPIITLDELVPDYRREPDAKPRP
jgi:tRNA threonylcarbamoyladenosine biosynthesis protein TsaB